MRNLLTRLVAYTPDEPVRLCNNLVEKRNQVAPAPAPAVAAAALSSTAVNLCPANLGFWSARSTARQLPQSQTENTKSIEGSYEPRTERPAYLAVSV